MTRFLRPALPAALAAAASLLMPGWAFAHGGHGASGAHWHATDAWGFVMLAAVMAAGVWWSRRK